MAAPHAEAVHEFSAVGAPEYRRLGETDMNVSVLGLGTSSLGSVFHEAVEDESVAVVREALGCGVNYIDTSPSYGNGKAESVLGSVLPTVPRDSFYVATKVGRYANGGGGQPTYDFSAERVLASVDESLRRMGLDYVDVVQVHDVEFARSIDQVLSETLPALQKLRESGKARYVGVTGYALGTLRDVIERSPVRVDTVLSYCRYALNDTALNDYLPFFEAKKVGVISASPIAMGLLSERGPPAWHPAPDEVRRKCAEAAAYCRERGVDVSRLALRFALDNERVATTLVSTTSKRHLAKDIHTSFTPLSAPERQALDDVLKNFMAPISGKHWEGKEKADYYSRIGEPQVAHEKTGA